MPELVLKASRAIPTFPSLGGAAGRVIALGASRGSAVAAQMAVQIAVGALAGPAGIGLLQLHATWSSLLGEAVAAGEPTRALRDTAVNHTAGRYGAIRDALGSAVRRLLSYSLLLFPVLLMLAFSPIAAQLGDSGRILILCIALSAPLFALSRLFAEATKALGQALLAVTLENIALPLVLLSCCAIMAMGWLPASMALLLCAATLGLAVMVLCLIHFFQRSLVSTADNTKVSVAPGTLQRPREGLHFWLSALTNIAFLQLPFLLMPWLVSADEIGRYAVAHKLVNVITTLLILLSALYGPRFARAAAADDHRTLESLLRETQLLSSAIFIPIALLLLGAATPLTALFSLEAGTLRNLLLILAAGQFLNAATGLAGVLLNMTGAARQEMRIALITCATTAIAAIVLGFSHGVVGIAVAMSCGIALRNLACFMAARLHLKRRGWTCS